MGRYDGKRPLRISKKDHELYEDVLEDKAIRDLLIHPTPALRHPTVEERTKLDRIGHVWTVGDRYYKLAHKHYGDARLWWVLAWYNKKPTEAHVKLGDVIKIPKPLGRVLGYFGLTGEYR